ncbi:MAG: hypothetical protein ACR2KJ_01055 [Jatrophihabitans sp.]
MHWLSRRVLGAVIVAALVAVGFAFLSDRPAAAATTRHGTLAVTGLVADGCPASAGGSQIFIKPGDTVEFRATLAGINLGVIHNVLPLVPATLTSNGVGSFNTTVTFADENTTSKGKTVGHPHAVTDTDAYRRTFPRSGVYNFGWIARSLSLLKIPILLPKGLTVPLSQNVPGIVGDDSSLSWAGQVVVSDKATKCGLSVQVPGVTIHPSVLGHKLPPVSVPGGNLPTVNVPNLPGTSKSKANTKSHGGSTSKGGGYLDYTPHGSGVAASVVPKGGDGGGGGDDGDVNGAPGGGDGTQVVITKVDGKTVKMLVVDGKTVGKARTVDLASKPTDPATTLPILWVLAALVMLSTATAAYAHRFIAAKH